MTHTVVVASGNRGKLAEYRALLRDLPFEIAPQSSLGVSDVEEIAPTYIENAILKARHAAAVTGAAAIADDSGLEVPALGGEPGIYSARYAGTHGDDAANNAKLLDSMRELAGRERNANFRCLIVYLRHALDPAPLIAEGIWHGRILDKLRGARGFGYDPLFFDPLVGASAAELDPAEKNRVSHRGRAMRSLQKELARMLTESA